MSNKKKAIIIIMSCILCIGAALIAVYFVVQNHEHEQERLEQQQQIDEVLLKIDSIYNSFTAAGDNRQAKVALHNELKSYISGLQAEGSSIDKEVAARLEIVYDNMRNALAGIYGAMIDAVKEKAEKDVADMHNYKESKREEIDELIDAFNAVEVSIVFGAQAGSETVFERYPGKSEKISLLTELTAARDAFTEDTYLADRIGAFNRYIEEMDNLKSIIKSDGVLPGWQYEESITVRIDSSITEYTDKAASEDYEEILWKYDTTLERGKTWFTGYYKQIIEEIDDLERKDNSDIKTIQQQAAELQALRSEIAEDGIIDDFQQIFDVIDTKVKEYEQEIKDINEQIEREKRDREQRETPVNPGGGSSGSGGGDSSGVPASHENISSYADEVLRLVNIERENAGLPALSKGGGTLSSAALTRAIECIELFDHTRPDGRDCFTAYTDLGGSYRWLGENIAVGYTSPETVMIGWMNSPGHRENILRAEYTELCVGVVRDGNGRYYWAQMFLG